MLKLKKNYTLKTLVKYGFHKGYNSTLFHGINTPPNDNVRIGNHDDGCDISIGRNLWIDNHSFYANDGLDTLYDLIKDGIVIKEENNE